MYKILVFIIFIGILEYLYSLFLFLFFFGDGDDEIDNLLSVS